MSSPIRYADSGGLQIAYQVLGDGPLDIVVAFDWANNAIRCVQSIGELLQPLGVRTRSGLHTGEVELMGEDIGGIAVHIASRLANLSGPGEVLVSSTVRDLVAGSGITFEDRGLQPLKGVPDEWKVFAAA